MISAIASANQSDLIAHQFKFKQQLENVVAKVAIASNFTISYEDFEPLEVKPHLKEYLNQISPTERNQYLAAKLQTYLYSIFCTRLKPDLNNSLTTEDTTRVANRIKKWYKTEFYQQLTQNNHGQGYSDPNWLVTKQVDDYWHVTKNHLTLHIKNSHLVEASEKLSLGKLVSIKMPSNLVDRGIYIAVGDKGSANSIGGDRGSIINQLYFNVDSQGALRLLDDLTQTLNQIKVPFDFKIAYNETKFDDLDAVVLEFRNNDFDLIYPVVQTACYERQTYFRSEIPFFCQFLSPGLGLAEKPRSPKFARENIGQHYCGIIAQALVEIWQQNNLIENKLDYVLNYLSAGGVDIERLYLNPHLQSND